MSVSRFAGNSRYLFVVAAVAALGLGAAIQRGGAVGDEPRKEIDRAAVHRAQELSEAFHNAADVAMPSVVTIRSRTKAQAISSSRPRRGGNDDNDERNPFKGTPFEDFFRGRDLEDFGITPRNVPRREGMGSGVIIDRSGIVLTNNHVVDGADEVIVHLPDGREFKGEDIKTDAQTDLAVIRIKDAGSLPAAKMGDSDRMRIGDWVIAIGNPFEQEQSVSAGIISGMGRELRSGQRAKYLQTDAAINPGNSGGPLVNLDGEVVGINTAIATNSGSFAGVGFAIPINTAKWVTNQLIDKGSVQRAYLGIALEEMTPDLASKFGVKHGEGALVGDVQPKTPASEAGIEAGDVVTQFDGHKVKNSSELRQLVERTAVDSKVPLEVLRDGRTQTLHVTVKAMPKDFGFASGTQRQRRNNPSYSESYEAENLGIEVADLTAQRADELGYEGRTGVLITSVDASGIAGEAGLREGMLIMKVGKKPVSNVKAFREALKNQSLKEGIVLHVRSQQGSRFVLLKE